MDDFTTLFSAPLCLVEHYAGRSEPSLNRDNSPLLLLLADHSHVKQVHVECKENKETARLRRPDYFNTLLGLLLRRLFWFLFLSVAILAQDTFGSNNYCK